MRKLFLTLIVGIIFVAPGFSQSYGDIYKYMSQVDKNDYVKTQRSYLQKIARNTSTLRGKYARLLAGNASRVKYLYGKAYQQTLAYESKMMGKSKYRELAPKINSLKYHLKSLINYSNTILVNARRIGNNYKSRSNGTYSNRMKYAYNSMLKSKKTAREKLFSIATSDIVSSYR